MKKLTTWITCLVMVLALGLSLQAQAEEAAVETSQPAATEETAVKLEQPILISSAGQSADAKLVGMLAKRQKLDAKALPMATASDLDGIKTLVIVPGFSSKGLGAAGVSQQDEMARITALVEAAQEKGIAILTVHVGGTARRGPQSDGFNQLAAEASSYMIVVKHGNEDNFFSDIAAARKTPIELVGKIAEAAAPLGGLFN